MPAKKRQHYVPRFLLRQFSPNRRTISLLLCSDGRRIDSASLSHQCYHDYFYGRDTGLEDAFGGQEARVSGLVRDLSEPTLSALGPEDLRDLLLFMHYQRQRTLAAAEFLNNQGDALMRVLMREHAAQRGVDLDQFRFRLEDPQFWTLLAAAESSDRVLDLTVKFVIGDADIGFVMSDAPVGACNQWAEHHRKFRHYGGYNGVMLKGLQWFLPVSPTVCVAVYDGTTYEYGSPRQRCVRAGLRDVQLLNNLQAIHARDCLYFDGDRIPDEELARLMAVRAAHERLDAGPVLEGPMVPRPDGGFSQIVASRIPDCRLGRRFHFARVTDQDPYRDYRLPILPLRRPEFYDELERRFERQRANSRPE